jgi:hypothetical protein
MTGQEYLAIARVIRDLAWCNRLSVAEQSAAMMAERDPGFDRNLFVAAALWEPSAERMGRLQRPIAEIESDKRPGKPLHSDLS